MFIVIYGSSVIGFTTEEKEVSKLLTPLFDGWKTEFHRRINDHWFQRNYGGNLAPYLGQMGDSVKVYDVPDTFYIKNTYRLAEQPNVVEVTSDYFSTKGEETVVGYNVTAKVVKKGLKSFGETVTVRSDSVSKAKITEVADVKVLFDKLARITVTVGGYGSLTLSPDSLGEYKKTPVIKQTKVFVPKFDYNME